MTGEDPRDALGSRNVRPVVTVPRAGLSGMSLALVAAGLALLLFLVLDAHRRSLTTADTRLVDATAAPISSPAPLQLPPAPVDHPPVVVTPVPPPVAFRPPPVPNVPVFVPPPLPTVPFPPPAQSPVAEHHRAGGDSPVLIVDATTGTSSGALGGPTAGTGEAKDQSGAGDGDQAVRATLIRNRGSIMPQGTLIAAVLETPLNSDRPGLARAVVSQDGRSFDGARVLIPRGSRLIGEFRADNNANQRRVLVTWTRLIRPDGVAIRIGSPAADALGGAGIPGQVNTHFFERFSNAVLQSALTIGINRASQSGTGSVYLGLPSQLGAAGQSLLPNTPPHTTIKVKQGAEISIFVAHDLDFGGTPPVR